MTAFLFAVAAGLCWAVGETITKSAFHSGQVGPLSALAFRSTLAIPLLWAAMFVGRGLGTEPAGWMKADAGVLVKIAIGGGLLAGGVAMLCFYAALHLGEISRVKPIAFATAPAAAVLLGWLFLGEAMTPRKATAALLIIAGVLLLAK